MKTIRIVIIIGILFARGGASAHERGSDATLGTLAEAAPGAASTVVHHKAGPKNTRWWELRQARTQSTTGSKAPSPKQGVSVRDVSQQQEPTPATTRENSAPSFKASPQPVDVWKFPPIPALE